MSMYNIRNEGRIICTIMTLVCLFCITQELEHILEALTAVSKGSIAKH